MSSFPTPYPVSGEETEYMYKKTLGVAYENPGASPAQETVSSLPYIFNNQIIPNNIPITAPSLDVSYNVSDGGTKWSTQSPYIFFYEDLPLKINVNSLNVAYVNNGELSENLTTHSIPSTYDPNGSYTIRIYNRQSNTFTSVPSNSNMPWIFDTTSGCVTFIQQQWTALYNTDNGYDPYPYISFYRYEGPFGTGGSGGSSQWTTSGNNIYNNNSGNVGIGTSNPTYTLDVSGSTRITNNNLNVGGNPYIYTPYSVGAPLAPQILTTLTSTTTSTSITFTWTPPVFNTNISTSVKSISATLYANISGSIYTYPILTDISSNINSLNTIIVTNQSSSNGFIYEGTTYNYYNSVFSNMQDSSYNQLILWYSNYSPYPNVSYVGYSNFIATGVPSSVSFNTANQDSGFNTINLQCYVTLTDASNNLTGPPYITNYKIPSSGYSTTGSIYRYPSPYDYSGNMPITFNVDPDTSANVVTQFALITSNSYIYPDCSYNFNVQASNNNGSTYGPTGLYQYYTKLPTYPPTINPSPLFNSNGYKYNGTFYFVGTTISVPNDIININNVSSNWTSNTIITPVQGSNNYGNKVTSGLDVSCNLLSHFNSSNTGGNVQGGVGGYTSSSSSYLAGITVQVIANTYDAYPNTQPYNQGFYLDCSTNSIITPSYFTSFVENDFSYNIVLTTRVKDTNTVISSSYTFYADDLSSNPSYNTTSPASFTLNSNNNYYSNQVSGIWVLNTSQNPVFSVSNLKLNNMGDYFYVIPLVTYNIGGGVIGSQTENDTTHVTNISGGKFQNPIDISNNNISGTTQINAVSPNYNTDISLNITFNNLLAQVTQNNIANINVICDQPSYNLITNLLATTIQTVGSSSSSSTRGYRVWSANVDSGIPTGGTTTMSPSGLAPYPYIVNQTFVPNGTSTGSSPTSSDQGYVNISYNNIWDISNNTVTNQELLIANGNFTTNNSYYLNYGSISSANGNTINYNGLANTGNNGKKYSTFVWNVNSFQNNIYFQIQFTSALTSYQNFYYLDTNNPPQKQLELYYRFEYTGDVTTSSWGEIGSTGQYYPNTTWISINSTTSGSSGVSPGTICVSSNITNIYYNPPTSVTSSGTYYTFKAQTPVLPINSFPARLYLRIGMPNNVTNNSFSSVKCYYSA